MHISIIFDYYILKIDKYYKWFMLCLPKVVILEIFPYIILIIEVATDLKKAFLGLSIFKLITFFLEKQ